MNKEINYLVHDSPERSFVRVSEKATFLNCSPLREFFLNRLDAGQSNFVVDFDNCKSLDSTFLGILVSLAIKVKARGNLSLINLRDRNLETVRNLGIHKIAQVSSEFISEPGDLENLKVGNEESKESSVEIYKAHKSLMGLNQKNSRIFRDVVHFLEQKVEDSD